MGITDHVRQFQEASVQADEAFEKLESALKNDLRAYLRKRFPSWLEKIRSVTDVVNESFQSVSAKLRSGSAEYAELNSERMRTILRNIGRGKLRDATKREGAEKRAGNRVFESSEDAANPGGDQSVDQVAFKELRTLVQSILCDEQKDINALINVLGIGLECSNREIEEILRLANDGKPRLSDSAISRQLRKARERLKKRLADFGQSVESDE